MRLRHIGLSGGEPLLRKDIHLIASDIVSEGLEVIIITNAVLLTEELLRKMPPGIHFEVTLHASNAVLHNEIAGHDVFDRTVKNISRIGRHNSFFSLVFIATAKNALHVGKTVDLGIALGARGILFNRVNLNKRSVAIASDLVPSATVLAESLSMLDEKAGRYKLPAACSVPIPPCVVDITKYSNLHFGWCPRGGKNSYYTIGTTGKVRPCNHSSTVLGDLRKTTSIEKIIEGKNSKEFWDKSTPPECGKCTHPLSDICKGGCRAASMECYDTAAMLDPFCLVAQNKK